MASHSRSPLVPLCSCRIYAFILLEKRIEKLYSRRLPNCKRAHTPNPKERGPRATTRVEKIAYPEFGSTASLLDFKCLLWWWPFGLPEPSFFNNGLCKSWLSVANKFRWSSPEPCSIRFRVSKAILYFESIRFGSTRISHGQVKDPSEFFRLAVVNSLSLLRAILTPVVKPLSQLMLQWCTLSGHCSIPKPTLQLVRIQIRSLQCCWFSSEVHNKRYKSESLHRTSETGSMHYSLITHIQTRT